MGKVVVDLIAKVRPLACLEMRLWGGGSLTSRHTNPPSIDLVAKVRPLACLETPPPFPIQARQPPLPWLDMAVLGDARVGLGFPHLRAGRCQRYPLWPAWKCVVRAEVPSHPGTPTLFARVAATGDDLIVRVCTQVRPFLFPIHALSRTLSSTYLAPI